MKQGLIYILEDDQSIRELLCYSLKGAGFDGRGFALPSEFFKALALELPDLVILDILLPEEDGLAVLARLRAQVRTRELKIIMLTALNSEYDTVRALDLGADDYLTKPFGMMEFLARVRVRLRGLTRPAKLALGGLCLDEQNREVRLDGEMLALTRKEFALLRLFLASPQKVLSRESLLASVWGYEQDLETRTLDAHILSLRKKLGACAAMIETVRGVGYRLVPKP